MSAGMVTTAASLRARHWLTHGPNAACGMVCPPTVYPPVLMPGACVDCPRCASQYEAFALATLTASQVTA